MEADCTTSPKGRPFTFENKPLVAVIVFVFTKLISPFPLLNPPSLIINTPFEKVNSLSSFLWQAVAKTDTKIVTNEMRKLFTNIKR